MRFIKADELTVCKIANILADLGNPIDQVLRR